MNVADDFISLHGGISQQDKLLRLPQQVEDSINCHHSLPNGVRKRNPTQIIKEDIAISSDAWTYIYDRGLADSENEKYAISFDGTSITAIDINTGEPILVNDYSNGYLAPFTSKTGYSATAVKDTVFITNRNKVITSSSESSSSQSEEGFVWVKRADPIDGYEYTVTVNYTYNDGIDSGVSTYTSTGKLSTTDVAANFAANLDDSYITVSRDGNIVRVYSDIASVSIESIIVSDSYGNQAMSSFLRDIVTTDDIPSSMPYDTLVRVTGTDASSSNYWLESKNGRWVEAIGSDATISYDNHTMPHKLERLIDEFGETYFNFSPITWDERLVGDEDSSERPSFIDNQIVDIIFYKNRLGFLLPTGLVFSEVGYYYNFWRTTQVADLDSDRIDIQIDAKKALKLHFAEFVQDDLIIFGNKSQFNIKDNGVLSAKTISSTLVSEYDFNYKVRPLALDDSIYFLASNGSHNGLFRYTKDDITSLNKAECLSDHCPSLLDNNITDIAGSSVNNMLIFTSSENKNMLYIYKYLYDGNSRIQSAWFKWRFDSEINSIFSTESQLYILSTRFNRGTDDTYTLYNGLWNDDEDWDDSYIWRDADTENYTALEQMYLFPQDINNEFLDLGTQSYQSELTLTEYVPRAGEQVRVSDKVTLKTIKILSKSDSEYDLHIINKPRSLTRIIESRLIDDRRLSILGNPRDTEIKIVSNYSSGFEVNGVAYEANIVNRNRTI